MRREFQYSAGTSRKFWAIDVAGDVHTVAWGRIGTVGQAKTKAFSTADEARRVGERLIQSKLREGYREVAPDADPIAARILPAVPVVTTTPVAVVATPDVAVAESMSPTLVNPVAPAVRVSRALNLAPDDWLWAAWRPRTPRTRPTPARFDQEQALDRLRRLGHAGRIHGWAWARLDLPAVMSREEATFWLLAMTAWPSRQWLRELIEWLAPRAPTVKLDFDGIRDILRAAGRTGPGYGLGQASDAVPERIVVPLANLCTAEEVFALLPLVAIATEFRTVMLPYLTEAEAATIRARVRPHLDPARWPTNIPGPHRQSPYYTRPRGAYFLAALLGLGDALLPVVESWADDAYADPRYSWGDHYHRPQEIIFGLGDPLLVEAHMRRLRLRLRTADHIRGWLAHTGYGALDVARDAVLASQNKDKAAALIAPLARVVAPEVAPVMLALRVSSKAPAPARRWLDEHTTEAAAGLLPVAAGRTQLSGPALEYLRGLKRRGGEALLAALAEEVTPEVTARVHELVLAPEEPDRPVLDDAATPGPLRAALAPTRGWVDTRFSAWLDPADLPPILVDGRRLNEAQVFSLLLALRSGTFDAPPAAVAALKACADPASLDAFAWALFEAWRADGAPAREKWALGAVGFLGGDAAVLRLAPLIRAWPGAAQHQRAVLGLECLRAIGSDAALMQIGGIAQKVPFKGLKARAQECLEAIAAARGLTRAALEDRIVPDCGLDEQGTMVLDFGPRRFRFALGPDLQPLVRDEAGVLRADLPKPGARDEAALARAAVDAWKLLKKQVREVARIQAARLEQAMVTGRRWTPDEFARLLVRHPLLAHLVRTLIWGGWGADGALAATFRVTEDGEYADRDDGDFDLEGLASVGLVHPLHLSAEDRAAWGQILGDYAIIPPFPQLGRPVYGLEPDEVGETDIVRFGGRKVPAIALVGTLDKRGWARGMPADGGIFFEHSKAFPGADVTAFAYYQGVPVGYLTDWDDQAIERCIFIRGSHAPEMYGPFQVLPLGAVDPVVLSGVLPLAAVDPVVLSEVLGDLHAVAARGE